MVVVQAVLDISAVVRLMLIQIMAVVVGAASSAVIQDVLPSLRILKKIRFPFDREYMNQFIILG